ncbi:MAG: phage holin family protein [bacterium]|nr:phage holin family protein [bacterium]
MIRAFLIFIALNTASVYLVSYLLDQFVVTGGPMGFVVVGICIGLLNLFVKPILKVLSLPLIFLTVGIFIILINALILWLAQIFVSFLDISGVTLTINGIWTYVVAVLLFGILNYLFQKLIR